MVALELEGTALAAGIAEKEMLKFLLELQIKSNYWGKKKMDFLEGMLHGGAIAFFAGAVISLVAPISIPAIAAVTAVGAISGGLDYGK